MKVVGPRMKNRAVRFDASRKRKPYRAKILVDGKPVDLGRYTTKADGEAACRAAWKVRPPQRPVG
jgi:hypothetical protein